MPYLVKYFSNNTTGIVIAGYGEEELFQAYFHYLLTAMLMEI